MSGPAGPLCRRPSRPRHHQRPVGIRAAWIGGGLTVLGGVIAALIAIFGGSPTVVNVNIGSARQPSPAKSSAAVFRDDFCATTGGWTLSTTQTGGHYNRCALHIYANGKNDIEFSEPTTAGRLPQDITIDVTARRILGSAAGDEFGIACQRARAARRGTTSSCKPTQWRSTGTPTRPGSTDDSHWRRSRLRLT
jgi:hypothetical protein